MENNPTHNELQRIDSLYEKVSALIEQARKKASKSIKDIIRETNTRIWQRMVGRNTNSLQEILQCIF